jgi:hypothetical protein
MQIAFMYIHKYKINSASVSFGDDTEDPSNLPWETPHTQTPAAHTDCECRWSLFSQAQCTLLETAWRCASSYQLSSVFHSVNKQNTLGNNKDIARRFPSNPFMAISQVLFPSCWKKLPHTS